MRPLRDDPVGGYPKSYARDGIPKIDRYPGGQSAPTPKHIDFKPGELLGSVSGELGLRKFLEGLGHAFVVTSDKEGPTSVFERELPDAEVVISQPFWPAYLTVERIGKAKKLKLAITAGIGSDHVDLEAAIKNGVTVAEVTYSNSISVSEHVVMMILSLIRNYIPSHQWVINGGSNIADCVSRSYDLEAIEVGTVAAGRIGLAVLKRLKPVRRQASLHGSASACGRSREGARPHLPTERRLYGACLRGGYNQRSTAPGDFNEALIGKMKRGAYLVNTARGKFCDRDAVVRALKRGQLAGYAGDVWFPQPPPKDHPWRNDALSPNDAAHVGDIIIAQARYAAGTREILECWFEDRPIRDEYLIVDSGKLAGTGGAFLQRRLHTTPVMTSRSDKPMPARMGRSCVRTQTIMGATETTMCCNSRFLL